MKTVFVIGAQGYVGRRIVAALAESGWASPVAGVRRAGHDGAIPERVLDATDAQSLADALSQADAVVNCLAGPPEAMVRNAQALEHVLARRPMRLVHFSSMAVYGGMQGRVDESCPLAGDQGPYGAAKARCEQVLARLPDKAVLRPGCIYGPGSPQWTVRIARLLRAGRLGDLGRNGDGCSNLVHIDDVVAAVLAALRAPRLQSPHYNLAMRDAPDWNAYFVAMAKQLGATPVRRIGERRLKLETHVAAPALKLAEIAARKLRLAPSLSPAIPPSLARLWRQDIQLDASLAERELGLSWRALAEGLRDSLQGIAVPASGQ